MLIRVVWVGRTRERSAAGWIDLYKARIERHCRLEILEVKDAAGQGAGRAARESRMLLERITGKGPMIALDSAGKEMTSTELATFLGETLARRSEVSFVLGGPEGLGSGILDAATMRLSLSRLTLTHEMARVLLLEQIYRSFTILEGGPYHR